MRGLIARMRGNRPSMAFADSEPDSVGLREEKTRGAANDPFAEVKERFPAAVINLVVTYPRQGLENEPATTKATGFIVDAVRGFVLTNKHVTETGPCRAKGIFLHNEEIDLFPIYRDPVHDYGLFKFDTALLRDTPLVEITLAPELAMSGLQAILIANNEGEGLTFIDSIVSRLDRPAPGSLGMNSFFITTTNTSAGGSSGSPLLLETGEAIGLMCGGGEVTSYLLPLERILRCLMFLRQDRQPPRGTMQVSFNYSTFEVLSRHDLVPEDIIERVRGASDYAKGLLVVKKPLIGGPGYVARLIAGDILFSIENVIIYDYVGLEAQIDDSVNKAVQVVVIRERRLQTFNILVQDLALLEVTDVVEISNGVFYEVDYLLAMTFSYPMGGVRVAKGGYMFTVLDGGCAIIKSIGRVRIADLNDFVDAINNLANGAKVSVEYQNIFDLNETHNVIITVDKKWFQFRKGSRNDVTGKWDFEVVENATPVIEAPQEQVLNELDVNEMSIDDYANAIVTVNTLKPFNIDSDVEAETIVIAHAIVLDKHLGIVLSSTAHINRSLIDVQLIFNQSKNIPAKIIYISPDGSQPFTLLKYDPLLIQNDPSIIVVEVELSSEVIVPNDRLEAVGYESLEDNLVRETVIVEAIGKNNFPILDKPFTGNGFFLDPDTRQVKLLTFDLTFEVVHEHFEFFEDILNRLRESRPLRNFVKILPVTFEPLKLYECKLKGLSMATSQHMLRTFTKYEKNILSIKKISMMSDAFIKFEENDIILAINGTFVSRYYEFHQLLRNEDNVHVRVLRNFRETEFDVDLTNFSTLGTTRIIHFAGLIVQDPFPELYYITKPEHIGDGGALISSIEFGSPVSAAQFELENPIDIDSHFIFKVNDQVVTDLQTFSRAISQYVDEDYVTLASRDIENGEEKVLTIKLDFEYWPTQDMYIDEENNDWVIRPLPN